MVFWTVAALLTLAASLAVLLPLSRRQASDDSGQSHDLEVYRDQLSELDRDAARGLVAPADVAEAHAEIARRILNADKAGGTAAASPAVSSRAIAVMAVIAVPLVSWGSYAALGSPDLPSQPLAARLAKNADQSTVAELVARAEAHLAANPEDGRGWDVLAPIYLRLGRADEAATAYRNAIRLAGASASREAGLGEALSSTAGGVVTAEAKAAFERALAIEPADLKARFYLAAALAQDGKAQAAVEAWNDLARGLPADSPWSEAIAGALAQTQSQTQASSQLAAERSGPDQTQIDQAASMSPADRQAMVEGMVASLDERLRRNPQDVEGWTRLVRSYVVLRRADEARDALRRGVEVLRGDDRGKLKAFAESLGISVAD
jgi:cytochrome c-type biogenesis protein CcmH